MPGFFMFCNLTKPRIFAVLKKIKIILWEEVIKKQKPEKYSKVHLVSSEAAKPKKQLHKNLTKKLNLFFRHSDNA